MSNDDANAARSRVLLQTQRLLEDAQRQMLMLPDAKPDSKEAIKRAQDTLDECNYTLHKCAHALKSQEQYRHMPEQELTQQQHQNKVPL